MSVLWEDRVPFIGTEGRKKLLERAMACAGEIASRVGVSEAAIRNARLLGCGNYGCTLLVEGLPRDRAVLKITSDNLEANAAKQIVDDGTHLDVEGLVRIHQVFRLGRCSVLPRMRDFAYKRTTYTGWSSKVEHTRWRGPGAPFRPLWVLQREELDDAWTHLKALGVKKTAVDKALSVIWQYAQGTMNYNTTFGARRRAHGLRQNLPPGDELDEAMRVAHGTELVYALDWLVERDMAWLDLRKVVNLGWRQGTGLVIRDIGFTASGSDVLEDIDTVGGARGRYRTPRRGR